MHSLYSRNLKNHTGTRRARPRSVFNVKLFNGNLESFIKVLSSKLPTRYCPTSFLFSFFLWLSRQVMGFPHSPLASICFKKFMLRWTVEETLLTAQWALGFWDLKGGADFKGCCRGGAAFGSRRVSLPAPASLTSCDPASLFWQREMLSSWIQWQTAVQLVRQAADSRPVWCHCHHPRPGHFTASHRGSCLGESFGGQLLWS